METAQAIHQGALPVCPISWNPNRLVSLWEMITYFDAFKFGSLIMLLEDLQISLEDLSKKHAGEVADKLLISAQKTFGDAKEYCEKHEFIHADAIIFRALDNLERAPRMNIATLGAEVGHVKEALLWESMERKFLRISPNTAKYLEQDMALGQQVYDAFPSARFDLTEAGTSLACGLNSAAGFHLMRAAEVGLWELGKDRQIPLAVRGKIEFSEWGIIISELETAIQAISQWPNNPSKEDAHKFYNATLVEIRAFNDGWRRHLAHLRKAQAPLLDQEAKALWEHVERFMKRLSTKISEGKYTPLIWS